MKAKILLVILVVLTLIAQTAVAHGQISVKDLPSIVASLITNPASLITFFIELALGIGLGYFSVKVAKYLLALVAIFVVGVLLNILQSGNLQGIMEELKLQWSTVYPVLQSLIVLVGLTTVLPITLGFIIGFIIGLQR